MLQLLGSLLGAAPPDSQPGLRPWTLLGDFSPSDPTTRVHRFQTRSAAPEGHCLYSRWVEYFLREVGHEDGTLAGDVGQSSDLAAAATTVWIGLLAVVMVMVSAAQINPLRRPSGSVCWPW